MKLLYRLNRWWDNQPAAGFNVFPLKRREFDNITELLKEQRILALVGPRRVGKSTLLYQAIQHLLDNGVDPKRILFFSADTPGLWLEAHNIDDIIEFYCVNILGESIGNLSLRTYVFIDEIHFIKDWQLYVKSMYDLNYNFKFIISGSSASHMFYGSKESLLGRMDELSIGPLDLAEYIRFANFYRSGQVIALPPLSKLKLNDLPNCFADLKAKEGPLSLYEPSVNLVLKEYLLGGGYPEYFSTDNFYLWQKRLVDDIMEKGLYRDIVAVHGIKQPAVLEQLVYYIASNQGQAFSYTSIGNDLKTDTATVIQYISYLAQAKLIQPVEFYAKSMATIKKKNIKLYVSDNGICNAVLKEDSLQPEIEGPLVENACAALLGHYCQENRFLLSYWRDKSWEVDFVVNMRSRILPVEVKYRSKIKKADLKGLKKFMDINDLREGLIITRNTLKGEPGMYYIPFWMLALSL